MQDLNYVQIRGTIASDPVFKDTRSNSRMASFSVVVKRKAPSSAKDYLDVIAWGDTASAMEGSFFREDRVELTGYVRKQFYVDDAGERKSKCQIIAEKAVHPDEEQASVPPDMISGAPEEASA